MSLPVRAELSHRHGADTVVLHWTATVRDPLGQPLALAMSRDIGDPQNHNGDSFGCATFALLQVCKELEASRDALFAEVEVLRARPKAGRPPKNRVGVTDASETGTEGD